MRILITGGAGYIGTALVEKLFSQKDISEVVIYDNLSRENRNVFIGKKEYGDKIRFVHGDILDSRKLNATLKGVDVVVHLAAKVTTPFSDQNPHLFEQVNNWGTAELVYAIEKSDVHHLIYLSSVSVYGTSKKMVTAEHNLNPKTFYGISKMRGEEHIASLSSRVKTNIIRCGNVYGYNKSMRFDAVINRFMFEANYNGRITINGTGEQTRPFIHINDVAEVIEKVIKNRKCVKVGNLVSNNYAIGEVVEQLRKVYPDLEMIFVNQHMKMRQLLVEGSEELLQFVKTKKPLVKELEEFKTYFTF